MSQVSIRVYDPPMCCSTGVCGPSIDPELVRFADDLNRLSEQGVEVERYNLAQDPAAFVQNPAVLAMLREHDASCLPIVFAGDTLLSERGYPTREQMLSVIGER